MTPRQLERADLVLRQTNEKVQALFYKVHNVQVEMQELRRELRGVLQILKDILSNPNIERELSSMSRETLISTSHVYDTKKHQ